MQDNEDAYQVVVAAGDGGNTMCHTSAAVEAEEARPIVGKVHIEDAGVEHPSRVVEAERAEAPWLVAVAFAVWHIADAEDAEVP
jgi:hypothetical protein